MMAGSRNFNISAFGNIGRVLGDHDKELEYVGDHAGLSLVGNDGDMEYLGACVGDSEGKLEATTVTWKVLGEEFENRKSRQQPDWHHPVVFEHIPTTSF